MCSADGKIRLATLELSCLLLKQQVVTSTGCVIKDVHLACLEVRASPHPVPVSHCPRESDGGKLASSGPPRRSWARPPWRPPRPTRPHRTSLLLGPAS